MILVKILVKVLVESAQLRPPPAPAPLPPAAGCVGGIDGVEARRAGRAFARGCVGARSRILNYSQHNVSCSLHTFVKENGVLRNAATARRGRGEIAGEGWGVGEGARGRRRRAPLSPMPSGSLGLGARPKLRPTNPGPASEPAGRSYPCVPAALQVVQRRSCSRRFAALRTPPPGRPPYSNAAGRRWAGWSTTVRKTKS